MIKPKTKSKMKLDVPFEDYLLQAVTEILGRLKAFESVELNAETFEQYKKCLIQADTLRGFIENVAVGRAGFGTPAWKKREESIRVFRQIGEFIDRPENQFALVMNPRRSTDLRLMLQAMTVRGEVALRL